MCDPQDPWAGCSSPASPPDPQQDVPHIDLQATLGSLLAEAIRKHPELAQDLLNALNDPTVPLGRVGTPATPADAPQRVELAPRLQSHMQHLWKFSLYELFLNKPGWWEGVERGGTLVRNKATGELEIINEKGKAPSTSKTFEPDYDIDKGKYELVGTVHTHPTFDPLARHDGERSQRVPEDLESVGFGGGDIREFFEENQNVAILESAGTQFMLVRTGDTPALSAQEQWQLKKDYQAALDAAVPPGSHADVTRRLTRELAEKYNLAYYEGQDGALARVVPP